MKTTARILTAGVASVLLAGAIAVPSYASQYDTATKTVTANNLTNEDGSWVPYTGDNLFDVAIAALGGQSLNGLAGTNFDYAYTLDHDQADLLKTDFNTGGATALTITGTWSDVQKAIETLYGGLLSDSMQSPVDTAMATALLNVDTLNLSITGGAEITPNAIGYIHALEDLAKGVASGCTFSQVVTADACAAMNYDQAAPAAAIDFTATGTISFAPATEDYLGVTLAEITAGGDISIEGNLIIPDGYDATTITSFFGSGVTIKAGSIVTSGANQYTATADNTFTSDEDPATQPLSPETGALLASSDNGALDATMIVLTTLIAASSIGAVAYVRARRS
jgi:hypothetical protein